MHRTGIGIRGSTPGRFLTTGVGGSIPRSMAGARRSTAAGVMVGAGVTAADLGDLEDFAQVPGVIVSQVEAFTVAADSTAVADLAADSTVAAVTAAEVGLSG